MHMQTLVSCLSLDFPQNTNMFFLVSPAGCNIWRAGSSQWRWWHQCQLHRYAESRTLRQWAEFSIGLPALPGQQWDWGHPDRSAIQWVQWKYYYITTNTSLMCPYNKAVIIVLLINVNVTQNEIIHCILINTISIIARNLLKIWKKLTTYFTSISGSLKWISYLPAKKHLTISMPLVWRPQTSGKWKLTSES